MISLNGFGTFNMEENMYQDFFEQNYKANEIYIPQIAPLNNEKVNGIFSHILNAHKIWNERFQGISPKEVDPWKKISPSNWKDVNLNNYQTTQDIIKFHDFQVPVSYANSKGILYENSLVEIFFHVLSHSAYHRGQLALLIRAMDKEPPYTDYIGFKRTPKNM